MVISTILVRILSYYSSKPFDIDVPGSLVRPAEGFVGFCCYMFCYSLMNGFMLLVAGAPIVSMGDVEWSFQLGRKPLAARPHLA